MSKPKDCGLFRLRHKSVFVMSYLRAAGRRQHYCNNIEAKRSVVYIVSCEKIAGSSEQSCFLRICDGRFGRLKTFIRFGSDLDKNNSPISINHNQVYFAGLA